MASAERIVCSICSEQSNRVGAQDGHDIYVCADGHITQIKVGAPRNVWKRVGEK